MTSPKRTAKRRWAHGRLGARSTVRRFLARAKQILTTDPVDAEVHAGDETAAQEIGLAGAELGGGVAKIAQLLGYRAAPTTADARAALASLWDSAPAMCAEDAKRVICEELGAAPEELFSSWSDEPFAAASIGQVHRATGADGDEFAVKVQYPSIAGALRDDLSSASLVKRLAGAGMAGGVDDAAVATIRAAVLAELDYEHEAVALTRFAAAFAGDDEIVIPKVIADRSAARVLTMSFAAGRTLVDVAADPSQPLRDSVGRIIFRFAWAGPLEHGIVQADPNPGNYLVEASGDPIRVAFVDYGCTAVLADDIVALERRLWSALLYHDPFEAAIRFRKLLLDLGLIPNPRCFHTELCREWERLVVAPFEHNKFLWTAEYASDLITYTAGMIRSGKLSLPAPLVLLWRQRLGVAAVLGMLRPTANFRDMLSAMLS